MVRFQIPDVGQQRLEANLVSEVGGKADNFFRILAALESVGRVRVAGKTLGE